MKLSRQRCLWTVKMSIFPVKYYISLTFQKYLCVLFLRLIIDSLVRRAGLATICYHCDKRQCDNAKIFFFCPMESKWIFETIFSSTVLRQASIFLPLNCLRLSQQLSRVPSSAGLHLQKEFVWKTKYTFSSCLLRIG